MCVKEDGALTGEGDNMKVIKHCESIYANQDWGMMEDGEESDSGTHAWQFCLCRRVFCSATVCCRALSVTLSGFDILLVLGLNQRRAASVMTEVLNIASVSRIPNSSEERYLEQLHRGE